MTKKALKFVLAAGLLFCLSLPSTLRAQGVVATIDLRKVFDEYYKTKAADAKLKQQAKELDDQRRDLLKQYEKATEEYRKALDDANDQALAPDEREKRKQAAEGKLLDVKALQQSIEEFDKTARTRLNEEQRNMREKILEEIRTVITAKAKQAGYALVIDVAAETINRTPVVLYNSGANDLTDIVLNELNATAPPDYKPNSTPRTSSR